MSAFVVEDKTINRIVTHLELGINSRLWSTSFLTDLGYRNTRNGFMRMGQDMFRLNVQAVVACYGERATRDYPERAYTYGHEPAHLCQVYKSLECWLYQCSEGDVPQHPLFKLFEEQIKPALADAIIGELPEYERAEWG